MGAENPINNPAEKYICYTSMYFFLWPLCLWRQMINTNLEFIVRVEI